MSRTDAHVPLLIRIRRGDIRHEAVHDHADGLCDLVPRSEAVPYHRGARCYWTWCFDGRHFCPCEMCHGGEGKRRERRAARQRARCELREATREWNTTGGVSG